MREGLNGRAGDVKPRTGGKRIVPLYTGLERASTRLTPTLPGMSIPTERAPAAVGSSPGTPNFLSKLPVSLTPDRNLLTYYILTSLLLGPAFIFILVPRYFRFRTLRYDIDAEGIRMRWGILFRREVSLTYARIQDIHLASNVVERWLDLGRIQVQTASGSASAELTIEGIPEIEELRNFLYERMRGARDRRGSTSQLSTSGLTEPSEGLGDALTAALVETAAEMRAIREILEAQQGSGGTR